MTVYGWDLSNHDWDRRAVDLAEARRAGISFVTHKATEGNWYRDPDFVRYARELHKTPFPVSGSYHVLNHGINVAAQVDFWVEYVSSSLPGWRKIDWVWQLDCEPLDGYAAPDFREILAAGQRLQQKHQVGPRSIVVYGPEWVYGDKLRHCPYRLWASDYVSGGGGFRRLYPGNASRRWSPYSGQTPLILQYSSNSTIGKQPECDANAIRVATEAALKALFAPAPTTRPQQNGIDNMTPAERQALIDDIVKAVWNKQFVYTDPKTGAKTEVSASTWMVYANRYGLAANAAISGLEKKVTSLDAAGFAQAVKNHFLALLGGRP